MKKLNMIILHSVFFAFLMALYGYYLAPMWVYAGFVADPSVIKIAIAACAIICFVIATPVAAGIRAFFLNFALSVYFIPAMVIYAYANKPTFAAFVIWVGFAVMYVASYVPIPKMWSFSIEPRLLMPLLLLATASLIGAYYVLGGFGTFSLNLANVYEFRREAAAALPGIFGYLLSIFVKILIPFGLVIAIAEKKHLASILFFLSFIILFGITHHKYILFTPFVITVTYLYVRKFPDYKYTLFALIAALFISVVDLIFTKYFPDGMWGWYGSLFTRRSLMLPPLINYYYIDFFSNNPFYYWATSRITFGLIENPYELAAPFLIGDVYFGNSITSANVGFIGSGFAQAGIIGVILYSAGVGLVFSFLETYGRDLGQPFVVAITVSQVFSLIGSSDLLTMFLTHGLLVSLILFAVVRTPRSTRRG